MLKRSSVKVFGVVTALLVLAMLMPTSSSGSEDGGKTLKLLTFFNPEGTNPRSAALRQVVDAFTKQTGIKVDYTVVPWDKIESQLLLSVQARKSPDITFVRAQSFNTYMSAGALQSLNKYIKRDASDQYMSDFSSLDATTYRRQVYGFPLSLIGTALFVRKDLLEKAGLEAPKTWDEFVKVAQALNSGSTAGFLFPASLTQQTQLEFLQSWIVGSGGKVLNNQGKALFDSNLGVSSFQFLKDWIYKYRITPSSVLTLNYDQANDAFAAGRGAMFIGGSHRYSTIAKALGPQNLLVVKIPGSTPSKPSPSLITTWNLGIPKGAANPEAAWKFINFASSPEQVLAYTKASGEIPWKKSVLKDSYFDDKPVVNFFANYMAERGTPVTVGPFNAKLNDIVAKAVQRIVNDPKSNVKEIVKGAVKEYNSLLK